MIDAILLTALWITSTVGGATSAAPEIASARPLAPPGPAEVEVWTSDRASFRRGDEVRVYFRSVTDGYVTILRVHTDGRVRILFPRQPWQDNFALGGLQYEIPDSSGRPGTPAFTIDDYPGEGYLLAVFSIRPFDYRYYVANDAWDYSLVAYDGRIAGDPRAALREIADRIIPPGHVDYWSDSVTYTVVPLHTDYPVWDPYMNWCLTSQFVREEAYWGRAALATSPSLAHAGRTPPTWAPSSSKPRSHGGALSGIPRVRDNATPARATGSRRGGALPARLRTPPTGQRRTTARPSPTPTIRARPSRASRPKSGRAVAPPPRYGRGRH